MEMSQISAEHLGIRLEELARAAIITQANALVLLRQARANIFEDDQELTVNLRAGQEAFEGRAKYYFSRLQPNIINRVSDADAAKSLFVAAAGVLQQRLVGPRGDAMQDGGADSGIIIDPLKNQMTRYRDEASELDRLLKEEATRAENESKTFSNLLQARTEQLKGAIDATAKAITQAEADRDKHLHEMVSKARNIGDAVKKFATGFIEIFLGKSDDKPAKPPAGGDPPAEPEGGGGGKKDTSFAVQAITAQEGVEGHVGAEQALIDDNKEIARLYRKLAESTRASRSPRGSALK